jgi:hypothetical protein
MNEFSVGMENQPIIGANTMVFINPIAAPNVNLEIIRMWIGQTGTATSAQIRMQAETQVTAFPTLVSTVPAKLKRAGPASVITGATTGAAGTAGTNASAEGGGAKTVIFGDAFNNLNGYLWVATPRETIVMPAGFAQGFGLFLPGTPATLTGWTAGVNYGEV